MQKYLLCLITVVLVSSISFSQMKLNLPSDIDEEENVSNLKLVLHKTEVQTGSYSHIESPSDATSLIPGTIMLGLLGDVTFPFGEDFKEYAGTGWSIHGFGGYSILNTLILALKVGYIDFGKVETDFNTFDKVSQLEEGISQTNSQTIIALAIQYLFGTPGSSCVSPILGGVLQPFVGIAICLIFKTYVFQYLGFSEINKFSKIAQSNNELEESSTIFGISPAVGTYINISKNFSLIFSADYYYLFDKADETIDDSGNINYLSLPFGGAYSFN